MELLLTTILSITTGYLHGSYTDIGKRSVKLLGKLCNYFPCQDRYPKNSESYMRHFSTV